MSFLRHEQIYRPGGFSFLAGVGAVTGSDPDPIVSMSSQLAIPWPGCTPALPASASPAGFIFAQPAETVNHHRRSVREFSSERSRDTSAGLNKFGCTRFSVPARSAGEK